MTPKSIIKKKALYYLVTEMTDKGGKAFISLRFQDGDYKESGNIIISCNKNEFKNLLESFVVERQKHIGIGSSDCSSDITA